MQALRKRHEVTRPSLFGFRATPPAPPPLLSADVVIKFNLPFSSTSCLHSQLLRVYPGSPHLRVRNFSSSLTSAYTPLPPSITRELGFQGDDNHIPVRSPRTFSTSVPSARFHIEASMPHPRLLPYHCPELPMAPGSSSVHSIS